MTHLMIDDSIVVHMLLLVGDDTSVEHALGTLATEREVNTIAGHSIMQGDDIMIESAVGILIDIQVAHAHVLRMRLLKAIEVERGIAPYVCSIT